MKKVLIIIGTRPEAIKMVSLLKELRKYPDKFEVRFCITAQHRQMLDQVLKFFAVVPDYDLNIMMPDQSLHLVTAKIITGTENILKSYHPDIVLVQGDTTTTFASALAAFYAHTKVGHIEAGLRTNNLYSPYPEEFNRQVTSKIATFHFAPTNNNKNNLVKEGIDPNHVLVSGNTVIDTLFYTKRMIEDKKDLQNQLHHQLQEAGYTINHRKFVLITGHRRESFGEGFENICQAIVLLANNFSDLDFVYPVHLNPHVREPVYRYLSRAPNIYLTNPLSYEQFVCAMMRSHLILTDSGGVQEEAPSLGKPVLVMRNETERSEAVDEGTVILVGNNCEKIVEATNQVLRDTTLYNTMKKTVNPYGDGKAAQRIAEYLAHHL